MIDRKEFAEELMLRENVRKAIRHVLGRRETKRLNEENELRSVIRTCYPRRVTLRPWRSTKAPGLIL